jgi:AraC family transcriptional regulator
LNGSFIVSARSRASLAAIDRKVVTSSDDAAWTSLLVERHVVTPAAQVVDIPPTPDQTIVVGIRGAQQIEVHSPGGWRRMTYRAGTVGLTAGGRGQTVRRHRIAACGTFEKINIYVPQTAVQRVVDDCREAGIRPVGQIDSLGACDRTVETFAHALVRAIGQCAPDLYAQSAAQWLTTHLVTALPGASADALDRSAARLTDARLSAVLELIRAEFAAPLSLDRLAAEARVSKYHFGRLFRQATGTTPHAYLVRVRLDTAREMLAETDLSVGQIARRCGYGGSSRFTAAFTAHFNMPPSNYRRLSRSESPITRQTRRLPAACAF